MKIRITLLSSVLPLFLVAQASFVNDGCFLKITAGTFLYADNSTFINQNNGIIDNNGQLRLEADFEQISGATYTNSPNGCLCFKGTNNQSISTTTPMSIAKLQVDNSHRLLLNNSIRILNEVDLSNNGMVELGNNDLALDPGASIVNYDANHYIRTNGTGSLKQQVNTSTVVFPVGNTSYNPAMLANNGVSDNFEVRVENQALTSYPAGIISTSGVVDRTWMINEQLDGGSDVVLTLQWSTAEELSNFDRTLTGMAHWQNNSWDYPSFLPALNVGSAWQQSRTGINSFSPFIVQDDGILPIELLLFEAERIDVSTVGLDWSTTEEIDNRGFEVQRMHDYETSFETVGWQNATSIPTAYNQYQIFDPNSYEGLSYYRLKQIDFSGQYSYSPVRVVRGIHRQEIVLLFPIPSHNQLFIRFSAIANQSVLVKIYAVDGQLIYHRSNSIQSDQLLAVDGVEDFASGTYHVQLIFENGTTKQLEFIKN